MSLHAGIQEANSHIGSVKPYFSNDSAVLFEKWTIGREEEVASFFQYHSWAPVIICLMYGAAIHWGQKWMRNRPVFQLRPALVAWNVILAVFSAFGAYRTIVDTLVSLRNYGLAVSTCHPACYLGITGFWATMFTISKVWELGDTFFIVLRKQKLQTLHWYHHVTVLLYVYYSFAAQVGVARFFASINFGVHTVMYTYFALRAARIRLPHFVSLSITLLQLTQLFVGIWASVYAFYLHHTSYCRISSLNAVLAFLMYVSYFYGFLRLFLDKYLSADGGEKHGEGSADAKKAHPAVGRKTGFGTLDKNLNMQAAEEAVSNFFNEEGGLRQRN